MQKGRGYRLATTRGVCVERNDRHCVVYRGARSALIAAGLARPAHFPEGPRRFSWHFPRSGINWGVRRKSADMYCLTKLKDPQGVVEAELAAFYRAAEVEARRDTRFQDFLQRVQGGALGAATGVGQLSSTSAADRRASRAHVVARAPATGLETLAVATLLVGLTVFFWTRQS